MPPRTARRSQNSSRRIDNNARGPTGTRRIQRGRSDNAASGRPRSGRRSERDNPYAGPRSSARSTRSAGGQRRGRKETAIAGFVSLGCFGLYILCIGVLISMAVDMYAGNSSSLGNMVLVAWIAIFSPFAGIIAGAIGLSNKRASKLPSIIGLCLNAIPVLLILRNFI